jgi:hypothetical protein
MSNIANQVIAVAATLLGFVAHDVLSDRNQPAPMVASATIPTGIDPVVTRSVEVAGVDTGAWMLVSPSIGRAAIKAPPAPDAQATVATRPRLAAHATDVARLRLDDIRLEAPGRDTTLLR